MSNNNMDDLLASVKKMVDSGNIPDDIKQMMNNLNGKNSSNSSNDSNTNNDLNNILSQVSPEMINNLSNILNSNNQSNRQSNQNFSNSENGNNNFNIDMNTIMKMKSIMENMNNRDDPRANLLYSLKPYLRDSKKNKVDQYVNLLNISKIADVMNKNNNNNDKKQ